MTPVRRRLLACASVLAIAGSGLSVALAGPAGAGTPIVSITTSASPLTTSLGGGPLSDQAIVNGRVNPQPGATVTFRLFGPNDATCAGAPFFTQQVPYPVAGGSVGVQASTITAAGTYRWIALYSGDANNPPASGVCNDPNETVVVSPATPSITTQAPSPVTVGSNIGDIATVTGLSGGPTPTGTVVFTVFGPGDPTCSGAPTFSSGPRPLVQAFPGVAETGSGLFTPTIPGTYNWVAVYSGDANYLSVTHPCGAPNESSVVTLRTPTLATQATPTVVFGNAISDIATVTGVASGPAPTGSVTFTLFGPNNPTCTGAPIFNSGPQPLGGGPPPTAVSGIAPTPGVGIYQWVAVYSGDTNYLPVTSPCGAPNEASVVTQATPTIATQATPTVTVDSPIIDTATVTGLGPPVPAPTGTVTFTLFGPNDAACAGAPVLNTGPVPLAGGPPPTASSGNFTPLVPGTYRWVVAYSGDATYLPVTSPCNAPNEVSEVQLPPCTTYTGDILPAIVVARGQHACITGARVYGGVVVGPGGALTVTDSQINRGIISNGAIGMRICATQIARPRSGLDALVVTNSPVPIVIGDPATGCAGNTMAGNVYLIGNQAGLVFGGNTVSTNVTVDNNTGPANVVKANKVFGALACAGNVPPPTNAGQPNIAGSSTGQCAGVARQARGNARAASF